MAETRKRIVKNGNRTIVPVPVNSIYETKLEFVDDWRQEILW